MLCSIPHMTGGQEKRGLWRGGGEVARIFCLHFVFTVHRQYIRAHQSYTLIAKPTQYDTGDQNIGLSTSWITAGCDLLHAGRHKIYPVGLPAFPALWGTLILL